MRQALYLLVLLQFAILSACGGGSNGASGTIDPITTNPTTPTAPTNPSTPALTGEIKGFAYAVDAAGPLANVKVSVPGTGNVSATTDADGKFTLPNLPEAPLAVIKFEAEGYAPAYTSVAIVAKQTTLTEAHLTKTGTTVTVSAAQANTISIPKSTAQVSLAAGSLVNAQTGSAPSGNVTVKVTPIDPATNAASMPGDYTAIDAAGVVSTIQSFGALNVEITDATGSKMNLAAGKSSTIRIPLATRTPLADVPPTIPLFYFDDVKGRWVEEGSAVLKGTGANLYYEGTVTHFSYWNADSIFRDQTIYANGCVVDSSGQPIANAIVRSEGLDYSSSGSYAYTDINGNFRIPVKRNARSNVYAQVLSTNGNTLARSNAAVIEPADTDVSTSSCLVLDISAAIKPQIVEPLSDFTGLDGDLVFFSANVNCLYPIAYQWYRNGVAINGATYNYYSFLANSLGLDNGAKISFAARCLTNTVFSNSSTLSIKGRGAPFITQQPQSVSAVVGQTVVFRVAATGSANFKYQWLRNGVAINNANTSTYVINTVDILDNGNNYSVVVENDLGRAISVDATLTVASPSFVTFTTQPRDTITFEGSNVSFFATVAQPFGVRYQWFKDGQPILGATNSSYFLSRVRLADSGSNFYVEATNSLGKVSSSVARLTVNVARVPQITRQPANLTAQLGERLALSVAASGSYNFTYQWLRDGTPIVGATDSIYFLPPARDADNGTRYSVIVTNVAGSTTSATATLTVAQLSAPTIRRQPADTTIVAGQAALFTVEATGSLPISYQWYRGPDLIPGATSAIYTTPTLSRLDSGNRYSVTVTNAAGTVSSNLATVTVSDPVGPSITSQPASVTVLIGQSTTFFVLANGTAPITYQWFKDGVAIPGATANAYTIASPAAADNGSRYKVTVTNGTSSVTSSEAVLTVGAQSAQDRDDFEAVVAVPGYFAVSAGNTGDLIDGEPAVFVPTSAVCKSGSVAATFDGGPLPAPGTAVPTSGTHTLASTFNTCLTANDEIKSGGSSVTASFLQNGTSQPYSATASNLRISTPAGSTTPFDRTLNGPISGNVTSSKTTTLETSDVNYTFSNGATIKNNVTNNLATFKSGSFRLFSTDVLNASASNPRRPQRVRYEYGSVIYLIGSVTYVLNGFVEFDFGANGLSVPTITGDLTLTANGVKAGRTYYVNNQPVYELTKLVQKF
jgi:hypothetical protein